MSLRDTFEGFDLSQLDHEKKVYTYFHKDISNTIDAPAQQDLINCGLYSLRFLLMDMYKGKYIEDFDTEVFRDQLLLYIVSLYIYKQRVNDNSYTFPKTFKLKDILMKPFKNYNIHQTLKHIFENQVRTQLSTSVVYLDSWREGFKESYSKPKNFSIQWK